MNTISKLLANILFTLYFLSFSGHALANRFEELKNACLNLQLRPDFEPVLINFGNRYSPPSHSLPTPSELSIIGRYWSLDDRICLDEQLNLVRAEKNAPKELIDAFVARRQGINDLRVEFFNEKMTYFNYSKRLYEISTYFNKQREYIIAELKRKAHEENNEVSSETSSEGGFVGDFIYNFINIGKAAAAAQKQQEEERKRNTYETNCSTVLNTTTCTSSPQR